MTRSIAFTPARFGAIDVANRFVMAPMSRNRATPEGLATPLMAEYYAQRATAGLIVTEGVQPSAVGQGFMNTPGLHSEAQITAWRQVTEAVHAKGGKIVVQLMHAGRIGHPSLYPDRHASIAPSAIAAQGQAFTPEGPKDYPTPRAMSEADINQAIAEHAQAARNAMEAGFDGIEIHAGNGFLIHQFMAENCNQRTDGYGRGIKGRVRFALEVIDACVQAIGARRVGVRISPYNPFNDIIEGNTPELYKALLERIPEDLAYLHIMEANNRPQTEAIRAMWRGPLILNPHADATAWPATPSILKTLFDTDLADGVCFGALFLANPDLVSRIRLSAPLNSVDETTFYGGGARGYTDYPTLEQCASIA
ncbi:N-ethylmaleimide reductase [Chromohalobacter marismortui]|uniref:N-ethylmaleimide reductase n=1 Tax=Chromohalobacter marismortui TaxID=42055 RepID=A0A4R7NSM0_9GAMM|nr:MULTISPECIES: alkene reductase [Chromohalobacter]MCI0509065.1 alkene reductase [Chromohalobacter sp.]MCI0592830.1 alkene reductase [Chromohalobacter sp.]TDU24045.1 N-ethylmaleimide reductase [Chromohalobacter marismortui]